MSNDLSQIEKLVLRGYFKRSEKSKQEEVEDINLSKISAEAKEILEFKAQNFDFEVKILDLDLDSGLFIAKGNDVFGTSVIDGIIKQGHHALKYGGEIEFTKKYKGNPRHGLRIPRAESVDYSGWIEVSKEKINCSGTWETYPGSPEGGTWELDSVKEST